ncbi:MAG: HAD family hydrolase [Deferrisomatales bacterium]
MAGMRAPVRAVSFDAGNTLVRVKGAVGEVYAAVARRHGVAVDGARLDHLFREVFAEAKGSFLTRVSRPHSPERERAWWRALVVEVFHRAGAPGPGAARFEAFFDELYAAFARPEHWELFPDVLPCLEALAERGIPAAVVSNWDSRLSPVLAGLGLAGRFRFVLTSAEFGAEKPDPTIFTEAVRRLGVPRHSVLHVGDLWREDVEGARAAGLQAIHLVRDRPERAPEAVGDLRELLERL